VHERQLSSAGHSPPQEGMKTVGDANPPSYVHREILFSAIQRALDANGLELWGRAEGLLLNLADTASELEGRDEPPERRYPTKEQAAAALAQALVHATESSGTRRVDAALILRLVAGRRCRFWPFCMPHRLP